MPKDIKENELGDRMMTGISHTSGIVNPGVGTPSSIEASQTPTSYYSTSPNKVDSYTSDPGQPPTPPEDVKALKGKVTPDEIISGIEYELNRMTDKNKSKAKEIVVANLKNNLKYYSELNMLINGDERVNENKCSSEEKKKAFEDIFSNIRERNKIFSNRNVDGKVVDAFRQVTEKVNKKRNRI